jgi:hypothetical protein
MKTKVTVVEEGSHPGKMNVLGTFELARVPQKGEYIMIGKQRHRVISVTLHDNGDVTVEVG